jgi:hypothetical protein
MRGEISVFEVEREIPVQGGGYFGKPYPGLEDYAHTMKCELQGGEK